MRDVVDVEAPRGDVGRDEHTDVSLPKALQRALALPLRFVPVNGARRDARSFELHSEPLGAVFRTREDECTPNRPVLEHMLQQRAFALLLHEIHELLDGVGDRGRRCDAHADRVRQDVASENLDVGGQRCGKHERLPPPRDHRNDLAHVVDETHVEHAIRFIEHESFDCVECD